MQAVRPQAAPEPQVEEKQAPTPPDAAEASKEEGAAEAEVASSAPAPPETEAEKNEEEDGGGSPTSITSWHGTPTWNDITTFSQVQHLPLCLTQQLICKLVAARKVQGCLTQKYQS